MGRDSTGTYPNCACTGFNPHAPMGRDKEDWIELEEKQSFNPHAPMGRDDVLNMSIKWVRVSIHTPLWGATLSTIRISF